MGVIDEIKTKIDIVDLVSGYATLQKAGRNFRAPCPFHTEKTPSFFVFPERQTWHCFGSCATGGDIFSFVMKKENVDFGEALRRLAERAGVQFSPASPKQEEEKEEVVKLRAINLAAAQFFHNALLKAEEAESVRQYLDKRGVTMPSIESFQLGYAPKGWDNLLNFLKGKGYAEKDIVAAGLAIERESGSRHDRFRFRLIFPIRDPKGNVVGFGGRALDDTPPKYLNSPQSVIFDKGGLLYGLDKATGAIRKEDRAVIVEGYMDVIIAHQFAFSNVIASMGTALSEKHIFSLKKLTRNVVLALDPDTAGETATLRGLEVAAGAFDQKTIPVPDWQESIRYEKILDAEIKVAVLPEGNDPDEVILKDSGRWKRVIEAAQPLTDYIFSVASNRYDLTTADGKSKAAEYLLGVIDEIKEPVRRMDYLQKLARLVHVEEKSLEALLRKSRRPASPKTGYGPAIPVPPQAARTPLGVRPLETYLLAMLLQWPQLRESAAPPSVTEELFENSENRVIFASWLTQPDAEKLKEGIDPVLQEYVLALISKKLPASGAEYRQKALKDCILRLCEIRLKRLKESEGDALMHPEGSESKKTLPNSIELNKKLHDLHKQKRAMGSPGGEENG